MHNQDDLYDAVIIGGGPGGISCALELHDSKLSYVLLERRNKLGGQLVEIDNTIRNYAADFFENGEELRVRLCELAERLKLNCLLNHDVQTTDLRKRIILSEGKQIKARTIVLATGSRIRKLSMQEAKQFQECIIYKVETNKEHLSNHSTAVVGGSDNALMDSIWLSQYCPKVYVICRSRQLKARHDVIRDAINNPRITILLESEIESLVGQSELNEIRVALANGEHKNIEVSRLVVKIGYAPNTEPFLGQVNTTEDGHIIVDNSCATSIEGVFAIGDIVAGTYPRIAIAVGQGMVAATAIRKYLGK